ANDNWSYNGQTLNGGSGSMGVGGYTPGGSLSYGTLDINIPQQSVSVTVNPSGSTIYDTSRIISGGTAPYSITTPDGIFGLSTVGLNHTATGTVLTIHGTKKGDTSMLIQDSSSPA